MRLLPAALAWFSIAAVTLPAPAAAQEMEKLTLDKFLDMESVASPVLSPDGTSVVFTRSWADPIEDRRRSELWIMNADGSRPRHLTEGSSPTWSPDGERIAFLKPGKPKGAQVHVMWMDTREVTQVTRLTESPSGIEWSPDGKRLAFRMIVPEKNKLFRLKLPDRPEGAKWAPEPKVITRLAYRRDRSGYRPKGFFHLFVVDADGGAERQVTSGDFDHGAPSWTADGEELVFSGLREEDADWQVAESEIYAVHVEEGTVRQLTVRRGPDSGPVVSPDGSWIAYTGFDWLGDTYHVPTLYVLPTAGGTPRALTADLDRRPGALHWSADSSAVFFTANRDGERHLFRAGLDGAVDQLTAGPILFSASDLGADGTVVGTLSTAHRPGDVARYLPATDVRPAALQYLTEVNADVLDRVTLGRVEEVRYPSSDGLEIHGWVVYPPDFDPAEKYPLILQIHGGPHGMYNGSFSFERQNHAAEGYVVLYTNPRGSSGYGKAFGNAIKNAYPGMDYDDLMAGVDLMLERGFIDEDQLFVYGGSGGGVLTCWIVGKTDRFAGAVSMFPVTNWISFVGTTDGPYWYTNFEHLPWENIDEHWERSPLRLVGNVTTPTLLITGELDLRTPMAQTEEYYQALKLRKVDTAMVRIPDEYHGAAGRHTSNYMRRILYVREWFERYRGEDTDGAAEPEAVGAR